jgi:hypothetical protein
VTKSPTDRAMEVKPTDRGRIMNAPTKRVLCALVDCRCNPKRNGTGWLAHCPAHDDSGTHLFVSENSDGRVILECQTGCGTEAVCKALGLTVIDLLMTAAEYFGHAINDKRLNPADVAEPRTRSPQGGDA